jgi:hypothetical protein
MEVSVQLHAPAALATGKEHPVPIGKEAGWALEPVWTLWNREQSLASAGDQTAAIHPAACRYIDWTTSVS